MKQIILEKDLNNLNEAIDKLNDEFETVYKDKSVFEKNKILDIKFLINQVRIDLQDENMQTLSYILDRNSKLELITFKGKREKDVFYFNIDNSIIIKQGEFLVLFLNADFSSDNLADNTFYNHFNEEIRNILKQFNTRTELLEFQHKLKNCITFVFKYETYAKSYDNKFKEYIKNNLYDSISNESSKISILLDKELYELHNDYNKFNKMLTKEFGYIQDIYGLTSISQLLYIMLKTFTLFSSLPIRKCQNCGNFFMAQNREDELYCGNIYMDTGKTCKQIGAMEKYVHSLEKEPIIAVYKNMRKRKYMKFKRNPDKKELEIKFEEWDKKSKIEFEKYKKHEITTEEFENWLNQNY